MIDVELTKWFATLGVGGSMAGIIFYFYHNLAMKHEENYKLMAVKMEDIADSLIEVIKENTIAFTTSSGEIRGLKEAINSWNGVERRVSERRRSP